MAIDIKFDATSGILRAAAKGGLDIAEYRAAIGKIVSGACCPATTPTIWDLREFDFVAVESQLAHHVNEIRSLFKSRRTAKIAYVVASQLGYGMMRMFTILSSTEDDALVCYDYDEAERWIRKASQPPHPHGRS